MSLERSEISRGQGRVPVDEARVAILTEPKLTQSMNGCHNREYRVVKVYNSVEGEISTKVAPLPSLPLGPSPTLSTNFYLFYPSTLHPIQQQPKMAPVKKSKSTKTSENINSRLQLVVKSGKVSRLTSLLL